MHKYIKIYHYATRAFGYFTSEMDQKNCPLLYVIPFIFFVSNFWKSSRRFSGNWICPRPGLYCRHFSYFLCFCHEWSNCHHRNYNPFRFFDNLFDHHTHFHAKLLRANYQWIIFVNGPLDTKVIYNPNYGSLHAWSWRLKSV